MIYIGKGDILLLGGTDATKDVADNFVINTAAKLLRKPRCKLQKPSLFFENQQRRIGKYVYAVDEAKNIHFFNTISQGWDMITKQKAGW
jgi:hypothetical protein